MLIVRVHTFSCFITLLEAASMAVYPIVKSPVSNPQVEILKSNSHKHVCLYPSMNQNIHRSKCQSHILWVRQKNSKNTFKDNYIWMKGMRTTSCAVKHFYGKFNPPKNYIHWPMTQYILLCIIIWTLLRRPTTSGARNPKVSNANGIKTCWLS
jgi:hypothetical protein